MPVPSPEKKPLLTKGRTLDHAAGVYDLLSPVMTLGQEGRYRRLATGLLGLRGDERVLDVGCGTGILTRQLAQALKTGTDACAVGLDAAPKMIQVATRHAARISNVRFDVGAAEALPYADQNFDCAVSTFFFHHIDAELKRRALAEIRRVLKPGGRLIIIDVDIPYTWFGKLCAWSGYWLFQQEEIRENIRGELRKALAETPFREVRLAARHSGYVSVFNVTN
ncbi:MAG TPA: methyltransferase domain-containing protein [Kiritimatiellia bacterium]|nr:methyltransferase domain-containing protein [Kiritimatiellia bacterium]HPS06804.1 methyltransferase domain-containing protein [Kiritimatiellia bacterium]